MAKFYFYHSPMNSGKSASIIMQIHNLKNKGKKVLVLKPILDTRDGAFVKSRALDTKVEALAINRESDLVSIAEMLKPDVIFVDEVNFLNECNIEDLSVIVDKFNISVFAYGLLVDYKSRLFEGSKRAVELADSVRELKTSCDKCDNKATMHLRKVNGRYTFEGESIQVGDVDSYESVCRKCYNEAKNT